MRLTTLIDGISKDTDGIGPVARRGFVRRHSLEKRTQPPRLKVTFHAGAVVSRKTSPKFVHDLPMVAIFLSLLVSRREYAGKCSSGVRPAGPEVRPPPIWM